VVYEHDGVRYTVLDAEPQRVKRVKIDMIAHSADIDR
jgi:CBS domain containing-hemolysin-like protein